MKTKDKISSTVDTVIQRLKAEGIRIQRYNAYSSNSVYLKLDYGVLNSVRFSDHQGKKNLQYRYNVLTICKTPFYMNITKNRLERHFFHIDSTDKLIEKILADREQKMKKYGKGMYKVYMQDNWMKNDENKFGFWSQAVEV